MGITLKKEDKDLIKQLLTPIDKKKPSGDNLMYEAIYDNIKEARREEDDRLPQGVWKTDVKSADWPKVEKLCVEALSSKTKDLQIALWLAEAWVTLQNVQGLHKSLLVITGFVDKFWKMLHPQLEDGDPEYRISLLEWMNERLPARIQTIQVTAPDDAMENDLKGYNLQNWVDANYLETLIKRENNKSKQKEAEKKGKITLDNFQKSQAATPIDFYKTLYEEIETAQKSLDQLETTLQKNLGDETPSFHKLHSLLESIHHMAHTAISENKEELASLKQAKKLEKKKGTETSKTDDKKSTTASKPQISAPQTNKEGREKAYQQLSAIANYLESIEPQSLSSHLVRRAVEWGNMSSAEFFETLAKADCDLKTVIHLLGLSKK